MPTRPRRSLASHEKLVLELLEPLSVALRNDTRLHELARLRESLEADKRALLTRLGRGGNRRHHRRRLRRTPGSDGACDSSGADRRSRAPSRRDGNREGARRSSDSHKVAPRVRSHHAGELRRASARTHRFGALRPRARELHRRDRRPQGLVRTGRRRNAVSR